MAATAPPMTAARASSLRTLVIALTAFFTVVDLFATQAILPRLAHSYRVTPAAMSVAVNASMLGMTIAGLGENCSAKDQAGAFAAYITGNVASNLPGRFVAANVAGHLGLETNFYLFALFNLAGAARRVGNDRSRAADGTHGRNAGRVRRGPPARSLRRACWRNSASAFASCSPSSASSRPSTSSR